MRSTFKHESTNLHNPIVIISYSPFTCEPYSSFELGLTAALDISNTGAYTIVSHWNC
ncbi:UNVERIFIED_CONTAM: hypothetical protein FKN15_047554 [Acipenser sinensis]